MMNSDIENMKVTDLSVGAFMNMINGNSRPMAKTNITLVDYLYKWLDSRQKLVNNTKREYKAYIVRIEKWFKDKKLAEVTSDDIDDFYKSLSGLSFTYIYNTMSCILKNAFKRACDDRLIDYNPCNHVEFSRRNYKRKRAATKEEINRMMEAAKGDIRAIYIPLMFLTGLRPCEALALEWNDVNFEEHTIKVDKQWHNVGDGKGYIEDKPKNNEVRNVPMNRELEKMLKELKRRQGKTKHYVISQKRKDERVSYHYMYSLFNQWRINAGVSSEVTPHKLRHAFATEAIKEEVPPNVVSNILGHKDINTTFKIYVDEISPKSDKAQEYMNRVSLE